MTQGELLDNLVQELHRGSIVLAVLSQLQEEQYGYSIMKILADHGLDVDQGTLYPLLRRLETQGLLESHWRLEGARPRRYYLLSQEGHEILAQMIAEWSRIVSTMGPLLVLVDSRKEKSDGQH
jgi:PadR family transcriptional regulator PadR